MRKNITLSADAGLIEGARDAARAQKTTLNQMFRDWLVEIVGRKERERELANLMVRLGYVESGGRIGREEMNER